MSRDPLRQFRSWFEQALGGNLPLPNAFTLATATADGRPSARVLLLKGLDESGFVFFTNYRSRKGREIAMNPRAAAVFYWETLRRQVRVEGRVERIAAEESDAYFRTRPRGARLGAWVSPQSRIIRGRELLESRLEELESRWRGSPVRRPPHWGGYRLAPESVEFWQGRADRLHDRIRYVRRRNGAWRIERLAP